MVVGGEGLPFDQMEEGSSDDDDALEAGGIFGLAVAAGAAGPPGAHPPPLVQASPAETLLRALSRRHTRARNRLRVPLSRPVGANLVLVKLIDQVGAGNSRHFAEPKVLVAALGQVGGAATVACGRLPTALGVVGAHCWPCCLCCARRRT